MEHGFFAPLQLVKVLRETIDLMGQGRLRVVQGPAVRFIWFADQTVLAITSALDDERLGAWLVARRRVMASVLQDTLVHKPAGERLGSALIRRGLLNERVLHEELEALSLALASRMLMAEGDYASEPGMVLPSNSRMVEAPPAPLFLNALRRAEDLDSLTSSIGDVNEWVALPEAADPAVELGLTEAERYILTLLKQPKSLDALRRVGVLDYSDTLRALACLATAGLISPAKRGHTMPSYRNPASTPKTAGVRSRILRPSALPMVLRPTPESTGPDPRLKALLERLEQDEVESEAGGDPSGAASRRRAEALAGAAQRLLTSDGDRMTAHRLLIRAADLVPDANNLLALARFELGDERLLPRALTHLKQALEKDPRLTDGWLSLADYWMTRGSSEKQRRCLQKILTYDPENLTARKLLAE